MKILISKTISSVGQLLNGYVIKIFACGKNKLKGDLIELKSMKNPHELWKKFKSLTRKGDQTATISPTKWVEHFDSLLSNSPTIDPEHGAFVHNTLLDHDLMCPNCSLDQQTSSEELDILNRTITSEEVMAAISSMSNNKAPGLDGITIEFIKGAVQFYCPFLLELFNRILSTGKYPSEWGKAILQPIYKKGNKDDPTNYRGIALLIIVSKIFTKILNNRLNEWADLLQKIDEEQAGFRRGYSTADQIFNLQSIIQKYITKKKGRCYVLFVDFATAFDSVPHSSLWFKLVNSGIHGNILIVLRSMYAVLKVVLKLPRV